VSTRSITTLPIRSSQYIDDVTN